MFAKKWVVLFISIMVIDNGCNSQRSDKEQNFVRFKKHVLTTDFISEGVAVGDVNKDGKIDVMAGAYWFEAPTWQRHELTKGQEFVVKGGYSNSFLNYSMDVNHDGWIDLIRIGLPGEPSMWYENPQNIKGYWKEHLVYSSAGNESPAFFDIDGNGIMDLICNDSKNKKVIWVSPPASKNDSSWIAHTISSDSLQGTHRYTHGLGLGDINLNGRVDVITREGWWEAPVNLKQADWVFHPAELGEECAQMYLMDLDADGDQDVISSSAHRYGIWWHEQVQDRVGKLIWKRHEISKEFSQTHGLALVDINNNGHPDLVTGKRYYAHNGNDPGANDPSVLYWFEYLPGKKPTWKPHLIDNNSGVGLHMVTQDITNNNLIDIIIANKKGVFVFEQLRR